MRHFRSVLIPAVLFLLPGYASAGWVQQASGTTNHLLSVQFPVDAQTGYAVGHNGTIVKTTDGGVNWATQTSSTLSNLASVQFPVDVLTGYVVGGLPGLPNILKTVNGGGDWLAQTSGPPYWLYSVHFPVDAQTGYAVGEHGTILKTTDGGVGVEEQPGQEFKSLQSVRATPNPFPSFARVPSHSSERFSLYDVSGRRVGTYRGDRIGEELVPGVYFIRTEGKKGIPVRVIKVRLTPFYSTRPYFPRPYRFSCMLKVRA